MPSVPRTHPPHTPGESPGSPTPPHVCVCPPPTQDKQHEVEIPAPGPKEREKKRRQPPPPLGQIGGGKKLPPPPGCGPGSGVPRFGVKTDREELLGKVNWGDWDGWGVGVR